MADTTPNQNRPSSAAKEQVAISEEERKRSGDYRDILKDSEKLLKMMSRHYDSMEARLESLNKGTINLKQINTELYKARQKQFLLDRDINESSVKNSLNVKAYMELLKEAGQLKGDEKDKHLEALEASFQQLSTEEQQLANLIKAKELTDESLAKGQEKLELEKKTNDNIGISGKLIGKIGTSLGLNNDIYADMVENARESIELNGKGLTLADKAGYLWKAIKESTKAAMKDPATYGALALAGIKKIFEGVKAAYSAFGDGVKSTMDGLTGTGGPISKFMAPFNNLVKQIPLIGGLLGGLVEIAVNMFDAAMGFTSETQKFARNLGLSYEQADKISGSFVQIANNSGKAYLTLEKFRESQNELSQALGVNSVFSADILASNQELKELGGLELDTRKSLAEVAKINSTTQTQIYKSMLGQTAAIRANLGVTLRFQETIKTASNLSGVLGLTFAKYPQKIMEAVNITKLLGMDLQKLNSIASGLLNFEDSISKEFEAQLLSGENINLQAARQAALTGNVTDLAIELNKQFQGSENFLKKNVIVQESMAAAVGMTRDEVADMMRKQELFAALGAKSEKEYKKIIESMKERGTLQSELNAKLGEEQAQMVLSQTASESIANVIDKIKQGFMYMMSTPTFKAFLDKFMATLQDPAFIDNMIQKLTTFAQFLLGITASIVKGVGYIIKGIDMLPFIELPEEAYKNIFSVAEGIDLLSQKVGRSSSVASSATPQNSGQNNGQQVNLYVQPVIGDTPQMASARYNQFGTGIDDNTGFVYRRGLGPLRQ